MSLAHKILYKPTITDIQVSREQSLVSNGVSSKPALNCCPPKFVLFARTATQTLVWKQPLELRTVNEKKIGEESMLK